MSVTDDVGERQAQLHQQLEAGERGGAGAGGHQLHLADLLADDFQPVEDRGADDDGGAVLVVVEHRDLHPLAQLALDDEALRRLDVLQVDAAEGRLERGDDVDQLVRVALVELDVEQSMPANFLNSTALPSITGLAASGPMAPRPSTAVPLVTTAIRLAREVRCTACAGSRTISSQAAATPGE